jgi:anti-anti-sigma factor
MLARMAFSIDRQDDSTLVVRGEIDLDATETLEQAALDGQRDGRLILDLRRVTFIDSSGLRTLVRISKARPHGLVLRDPSDKVDRLMKLVGLSDDRAGWTTEHTSVPGDGPGA